MTWNDYTTYLFHTWITKEEFGWLEMIKAHVCLIHEFKKNLKEEFGWLEMIKTHTCLIHELNKNLTEELGCFEMIKTHVVCQFIR